MFNKHTKIQFYTLCFLLLNMALCFLANGQFPVTSHAFTANSFNNPAFSGLQEYVDVVTNYRNQWPGMGNAFATYKAGIDGFAINKSGIGAMISNDISGGGTFQNTGFDVFYTYNIKTSSHSNLVFSVQASLFQSVLNDQGITSIPEWNSFYVESPGTKESKIFPDFTFAMAFGNQNLKIGVATFHLLEPELIEQDPLSKIKRKYNVLAKYTKPINSRYNKKDMYIKPVFMIDYQNDFFTLFYGSSYQIGIFEPGIWLRQQFSTNNSSTIILSSKINYLNLYMVYTFDVMLTNSYLTLNNFGVHEVTLGYHIKYKGRKYKDGTINCPY